MPDGLDFSYSDPRFLRQKIASLEADIKKLKQQTLPVLVHQRGPLPGYMRAIAINDQGLKGSMWANYTNIGPGSGPYQAVTDAAGTIRVEVGNLAANGNSPAQYGLRANAANGSPIFDSLGLINVASVLGNTSDGAGTTINSTTYVVESANCTFTFNLARQSNVFALGLSTAFLTGAAGNANSQLAFDGTIHGVTGWWDSTGGIKQAVNAHFITLAAGSHTIDLRIKVDVNTITWNNLQSTVMAFLFGT